MQIITLAQIQAAVTPAAAISAIQQAFIDFADGKITLPEPTQILFPKPDGSLFGDCHVKAAQGQSLPYFSIKVATGFYDNGAKDLPVNNGLVLVLSAETGQPVALLQDEGWLTQIRTAAAGAIAASLKPVSSDDAIGIVGAGAQAELQAVMISRHLGLNRIHITARNMDRAEALCTKLRNCGLDARACPTVAEVCQRSKIVVTTTPATSPVVHAADLPKDLHIVAVGADSPGKSEIAPDVFACARTIITDSHEQCLQHGDFGNAVRANCLQPDADLCLGKVLSGDSKADLSAPGISIVDLTGLGAQDLAMANLVMAAQSKR